MAACAAGGNGVPFAAASMRQAADGKKRFYARAARSYAGSLKSDATATLRMSRSSGIR